MTRVEPALPAPPRERRWHLPIPRFSIGRLIKFGLLLLAMWAVVAVARTGLWTIPIASALTYHAPAPVHAVTAAADPTANLQQRLTGLARSSVSLTESELTALAQAGAATLHLGIQRVTIATLDGNALELSFTIPQRHNALVRLNLTPTRSESGTLDFQVTRTRIGEVDVPSWLIAGPTRVLLTTELRPFLTPLPPIQSVRTTPTALVLSW